MTWIVGEIGAATEGGAEGEASGGATGTARGGGGTAPGGRKVAVAEGDGISTIVGWTGRGLAGGGGSPEEP